MPLLDLPLAELHAYTGTNPRPADFDQYWDDALAEMRAVDPRIELVPHPLPSQAAECFHLYFTGVGGARIHAQYLRPRQAEGRHPAIVQFHGYNGNAGEWQDKLAWVSQGYSVAALDVRGQSGLSEDVGGVKGKTSQGQFIRALDNDNPHKLLFRDVFLDTAQLAGIVMQLPEVDPARVGAYGQSQGGALTLACAALEPLIKKAASVFPFLSDYKRVWEMDPSFRRLRRAERLLSLVRPHPRPRKRNLHPPRLYRYPKPRPKNPRRSLARLPSDGPHLPTVHPVRRLQQNHRPQASRRLPRLRPRNRPWRNGRDLRLHERFVATHPGSRPPSLKGKELFTAKCN